MDHTKGHKYVIRGNNSVMLVLDDNTYLRHRLFHGHDRCLQKYVKYRVGSENVVFRSRWGMKIVIQIRK